jgi:hypothetical protein
MSDPLPITAEQDMANRLRPAGWQLTGAQVLLLYAPPILGVDRVVVALALPGKQRGVWVSGQAVESVNGFWYAAAGTTDDNGLAEYRARAAAEAAAVAALAGRVGIPAHAVIDRLGNFTVFEGHDPGQP